MTGRQRLFGVAYLVWVVAFLVVLFTAGPLDWWLWGLIFTNGIGLYLGYRL